MGCVSSQSAASAGAPPVANPAAPAAAQAPSAAASSKSSSAGPVSDLISAAEKRADAPEVVVPNSSLEAAAEEDGPQSVKLTIIGATGLRHSDHSASEPYCRAEIQDAPESRKQTHAISNGPKIQWNCPLEVENFTKDSVLVITVLDNSDNFKEEVLGTVSMNHDQLAAGFEGEVQLQETNGNIALLDLQVSPTDPTLLQRVQNTVEKAQHCAELAKEVVEEAVEEAKEAKDEIVGLVENRLNFDESRDNVQIDGPSRSVVICC